MKTIIFTPRTITRRMIASIFLYVLFVTRLLASPVLPPDCATQTDSVKRRSGVSNYVNTSGTSSTEISYQGDVAFTDDDRDIKSISPGGFFRFSKTTFGNRREVFIQSGSDGALKRKYLVGRQEEAYEPEGRKWLQEMLPEIIASSGIGAEDRVKRIYGKSGLNGVLNMVGNMESDYTQSIYYNYLFTLPNLKENELTVVLAHVKDHIESDYEMGKLLRKVGPIYLQNERVASEYLKSVNTMSSDYEKSRVLSSLLQTKLSPANFTLVMGSVAKISSDYEQANVLRKILANQSLTDKTHKEVLALVSHLSSDYEKTRVLRDCVANTKFVGENYSEILSAINNISSDYEKGRAISYLLTKYKLSAQNYLQLFPVVANISSGFEKSSVLNQVKKTMPMENAQVKSAYLKTAKTISGDYEYRRVVDGLD